MEVYVFGDTPPHYMKKFIFLKIILEMFSTLTVMQTGNVATCRHVSLIHYRFMSF